jgi:hypothetical protein
LNRGFSNDGTDVKDSVFPDCQKGETRGVPSRSAVVAAFLEPLLLVGLTGSGPEARQKNGNMSLEVAGKIRTISA